jgi:Sec-independent protein secretion pathway component TatC
MLLKIFGGTDIIFGGIILLGDSLNFSPKIILLFGFILIAKSSMDFLKNLASWIDFIAALILLISIITDIPMIIRIIVGIGLIQKGFFSFVGRE